MIDIQHLLKDPQIYKDELKKRYGKPEIVDQIIELYEVWKKSQQELDSFRTTKNEFNKKVVNMSDDDRQKAIEEMKSVSNSIKDLEAETKDLKDQVDALVIKLPNISASQTPMGKSDQDNPVIGSWGEKPEFDFEIKPYWELDVYKKYVSQTAGVKAMGARGYYLTGEIARFQKVLMDYALDTVLKEGFELFYVPLMLNAEVLTGTGHLPDFDGQQYEIQIDENKSFYMIASSEPSIMGYFMNEKLGKLDEPIKATCLSTCFRKEAGSYGKDQQGILRVHQFEKVEMVVIGTQEQCLEVFDQLSEIDKKIYSSLGLYYQGVEVCSGDMPHKHYRQIDYEAWFPAVEKFREICSCGNASDFQNRGLGISYMESDEKKVPWGLNCTAITFRAGLAIMEQNQTADGRVRIPEVLVDRFGKEYLE